MEKLIKAKANTLNVKKTRKQSRLAMLDDDDIPVIHSEEHRKFWGNATTGYLDDKDNK